MNAQATFTFNFTTREEYKAQLTEWKLQYGHVSRALKDKKKMIKDANRELSKVAHSDYWRVWRILSDAQHQYRLATRDATALITARQEAKKEAQRQYMAAKEIA